jgi:ABC-type transport system substrate-binding protein
MHRLTRRAALGAAASWPALARAAPEPRPPRTLRVAFDFAETGFDPAQVSDATSLRICAHIFEPLLSYDYLARPARLVPLTAAALPEVLDGGRRFVFELKRGILFGDDPAFGGKPRELVAADVAYTIRRFYDPAVITEHLYLFENEKILGLSELRRQAIAAKTRFAYDAPVDGLRVLDRYRLQITLAAPSPRFVQLFAYGLTGTVARELVERYGRDIMAHPVGTGPFVLAQWRRGSRIVLERNPRFRRQLFDTEPPAGDARAQALASALAGRTLPLLDRVEATIIDEAQPRWLAFLRDEIDALSVPAAFAAMAMPGGTLAPFLARRGVQARRSLGATVSHTFFNFDDPLVGGYTPDKVALRRAIALALDSAAEIRLVEHGLAVPAQTLIPPHCYGYDPGLKTEMSDASLARANALLDLHGYLPPAAGGWRRRPDGAPLVLRLASTQDQRARQRNELWQKRLEAVGLPLQIEIARFGELIKRSLAGQLMMWGFIWSAGAPDADFFLGMAYGPNGGQSNDARFSLPAFDRLYERQHALPDGPERLAVIREATRLQLAYVPYIPRYHGITTDLTQARVRGYWRHPFTADWWRYTEVIDAHDPA